MNAAAPPPLTDENDSFPVARIDAQDTPYVLPLREFLETNGVRVFVNENPNRDPLYHIVVGEVDFVKHILSRPRQSEAKRLAIIVGLPTDGTLEEGLHAKIYLADAAPISPSGAFDIFEFFFTGEKAVLDGRKQTSKTTRVAPEIPEPPDEARGDDSERIGNIIADVFAAEPKSPAKKEKPRRRKKPHMFFRVFGFVATIVIVSVFWYGVSLGAGTAAIVAGARSLEKGAEASAGWKLSAARYWTNQARFVLGAWSFPLTFIGFEKSLRGQERLISFLTDAERAVSEIQAVAVAGKRVASGLLNQVDVTSTGTTPASDIGELRTSVMSAQNTLGLAQAQLALLLEERTFPFSLSQVANRGTEAVRMLSSLRMRTADIDRLLSLFLQLSGFGSPKTYLILLQNSMELRPTGGFIGSVAIATFADGRLTNLDIQDVYTLDGQLKGHVDPPIPIREILASEHWYLRDSNWDPNFFASATRAAWFYQKETGSTVDGVFAVNVPFVAHLLAATGPVDLPDYDDRITADNFYGKALYYTQQDFFPGSTQKKDFLGSLARALIEKTTTGKGVNSTSLFDAITTSLAAHDLLFMLEKDDLQAMVEHFGWAGRVPSVSGCTGSPAGCRFDSLAIVEANLGVNKGSYFIKRSLDRDVTVDAQGLIHEAVTLKLTNTSGGDSSVPYRAYIRLVLPQGHSIREVSLNGSPLKFRAVGKAPSLPYMERSDAAALGIALDIAPGTESRLVVSYELQDPIVFGPAGAVLELFDQKQPGVDGVAEHVTVLYPSDWTAGVEEGALGAGEDFIAKEGKLEYNTVLTRDVLTRIRLTR